MKPVTIFGVKYNSIKEAHEAYPYLSAATLAIRIQKGYTDEKLVEPPGRKAISVTIEDKHYQSVAAAARDSKIPYPTYLYRVNRLMNARPGETVRIQGRRDTHSSLCKEITIHGIQYSSYVEAAEKLGINYQTLVSRIKRGWHLEDPNAPPQKNRERKAPCWGSSFSYNGVFYRSHSECARAHGTTIGKMMSRLKGGYNMEIALDPRSMKQIREEQKKRE